MSKSGSWDYFYFERTKSIGVNDDTLEGAPALLFGPTSGEIREAYIDWGDNSPVEHYTNIPVPASHTYKPGSYTFTCTDAKRPDLTHSETIRIVKGLATLDVKDTQDGQFVNLEITAYFWPVRITVEGYWGSINYSKFLGEPGEYWATKTETVYMQTGGHGSMAVDYDISAYINLTGYGDIPSWTKHFVTPTPPPF